MTSQKQSPGKATSRRFSIGEYQSLIDKKTYQNIKALSGPLKGLRIAMVSSTPTGGGVAEILNSLVKLLNSLGLRVDWHIIDGSNKFFQITKSFHNALQGEAIKLNHQHIKLYERTNQANAKKIDLEKYDLVVIHDPQPLALIAYVKKRAPWIWRCHLDLSRPNNQIFNYLSKYIEQFDGLVFSSPAYRKSNLKLKQYIIPPSIDPLIPKNKMLPKKDQIEILKKHSIKLDKPIIAQISRFDKWKDPLGVVKVFEQVRKKIDCQLVLLGNLTDDDPEGPKIHKQVLMLTRNNSHIIVNCEDNDRLVNALQSQASVIIQKSIKEGFGLTVSEALWKNTPVVGAKVGGIPLQIINGRTGYLVTNQKQAVAACLKLLRNRQLRTKLGHQGHNHVQNNFLITRHLLNYLKLFNFYLDQ